MVDPIARKLVDAASAFRSASPWSRTPEDAPFLIRIEGGPEAPEGTLLAATIIGQAGTSFGLVLTRGEGAFAAFVAMILEEEERALDEECDLLTVSFDVLADVPPELRRTLTEAGFSARREQVVPTFSVKRPHHQARAPNRGEMRLMTVCLRTVVQALAEGSLEIAPLDPERREVLELAPRSDRAGLALGARRVPWPAAVRVPEVRLDLGPGLERLPRREARWFADLIALPGHVRGRDETPRVFALADPASERLLAHAVVLGADLAPAAEALDRALRGEANGPAGRPRAIDFGDERLHGALAPALAALDIATGLAPTPAFLVELGRDLAEKATDAEARAPAGPEDWRGADRRLVTRLGAASALAPGPRALARFFGSEEDGLTVLKELAELAPVASFLEWFWFDYRSTRRSPTFAERFARKETLDATERRLLDAHAAAELSLLRIDRVDPGTALEATDVLTGARHVLRDRALSETVEVDVFLPLRLVRIEDVVLPVLAGPPLSAGLAEYLLEDLERRGIPAEGESLRPHADLIGRAWTHLLPSRRRPVVLQNTDGDRLELVTATFRVEDPLALRRALTRRPDVEPAEAGTWIWFRARTRSRMEERTLLARLRLGPEGRSLEVDVNSAERLARLRSWLEALEGVRFERSRSHAPDVPVPGYPASRATPAPAHPRGVQREGRAALEAALADRYRSWLDEPVPALGDLTPRKAARVPAGRRRVFRMIQTMPAASSPFGPIAPPRAMLLRELGFEA